MNSSIVSRRKTIHSKSEKAGGLTNRLYYTNLKNMMRSLIHALIILICLALNPPTIVAQTLQNSVVIKSVIDGDTLLISRNKRIEKVRLIGIDAPETQDNEKAHRDSLRSGIELKRIFEMGKQARLHLQTLARPGAELKIEFDTARFDKYGRTLAYLYSTQGESVNQRMLEDGYAYPLTVPPNTRFESEFRKAFRRSREMHLGLWK